MKGDTLNYDELKREYENYQISSELQMQKLSRKIMKLERDINVLANIVEISKYINTYLSDENIISMINDMILGLLGVSYSTILIEENGQMNIKVTNIKNKELKLTDDEKAYIKCGKSYLINDKSGIRYYEDTGLNMCSVMGMPIKLRNKYAGFIVVEHKVYNFLDKEHNKFLQSIANQIAIGLDNFLMYKKLHEITKNDPLLGIYNRRYFFEVVEKKISKNPLNHYAIVMMDLDDFKKANDLYGHQFGDATLIQTAKVIQKELGEKDILARYGGEELIIYIDDYNEREEVIKLIESIRCAIEKNKIVHESICKSITASIGIGFSSVNDKNINDVIKKADALLYRAKAEGKNRVVY